MIFGCHLEIDWNLLRVIVQVNTVFGSMTNGEFVFVGGMAMRMTLKLQIITEVRGYDYS